jgi:hypothetical protein
MQTLKDGGIRGGAGQRKVDEVQLSNAGILMDSPRLDRAVEIFIEPKET